MTDTTQLARIYQMSLQDRTWKLGRNAPSFSQRFTGAFSLDGTTITGRWESSSDRSHWKRDFDITYTRSK